MLCLKAAIHSGAALEEAPLNLPLKVRAPPREQPRYAVRRCMALWHCGGLWGPVGAPPPPPLRRRQRGLRRSMAGRGLRSAARHAPPSALPRVLCPLRAT